MELNQAQKDAAFHLDGPLLIIAGAGSGKTRVLIERIANIIGSGRSDPGQILAVTFTNKAARELKERLVQKTGESGKWVKAGTFHSVCASILRKNASLLDHEPNFVIYDTKDKEKVIKKVIIENGLERALFPYKKISSFISALKNKLIYPEDYSPETNEYFFVKFKDIYTDYQKELVKCNAVDFDDLLSLTVRLFRENEDILFEYQNMLKYICVDEYQDTNFVQDKIIEMLSGIYLNVCVVGDEDQSIYSWRGADISNILNFRKKYPGTKLIQLEQNYRSTENILKVANSVISKNVERLGKKLFTTTGSGEKVVLLSSHSDKEEGVKAVDIISGLIDKGEDLNTVCILYRTNSQSRIPEENLRKKGLPYTIVGGVKFYERKEIKDITAYLKLCLNPKDDISFERIINLPPRGIGKKTMSSIKERSFKKGIPYYEALTEMSDEKLFNTVTGKKVRDFADLIRGTRKSLSEKNAEELAVRIFERSGLKNLYTRESERNEDNSKIDNLYEFLSSISDFARSEENNSLQNFLESVSLMTDIDTYNGSDDRITLMTVHSAKGLEFDNVIIIGMNEGLFPFIRSDEKERTEEERRLFYVALTRARKRLFISTYFQRSRYFGNDGSYSPSRFLEGLPEEVLDKRLYDQSGHTDYYGSPSKFNSSRAVLQENDYTKNELVYSRQFGEGVVLMTEGSGKKRMVMVDFDDFGIKKLLVRYADLKKI